METSEFKTLGSFGMPKRVKRKVMISFDIESELSDNDLHNVMDGAIELGLDYAITEKKIKDYYEFSSKRVLIMRKGGSC